MKRGEHKKDVSEIFNISRNTLDLWLKREETIKPSPTISFLCRHKIKDWQKFREFVQQHDDKTQAQLAFVVGRQRESAKH